MLALAALSQGIVWSSCSPDFGVDGVLDRFGQIEPKVLFVRRRLPLQRQAARRRSSACARSPSGCRRLRKVVVVPYLEARPDISDIPKAVLLDEWLRRHTPGDIAWAQLPFDHPVYILFTSGTTGKPKCIVHGAGGTLLAGLKMYKLQLDVRAGRPLLLLHHLQLGDVEPAVRRTVRRGDA